MSLIADGILIVTCLTTAVYCYVLSRRLTRLSRTDEGIGKQIAQLNAGLEDTRAAVKEIRATTKAASEKLAREVAHARKIAIQLSRLNENAADSAKRSYPAEPAGKTPLSPDNDRAEPVAKEEESQAATAESDEVSQIPEIIEEDAALVEPQELDDDAAAELDASESAFVPEGGQQLGFLPELDVLDDLEEDLSLGDGSELEADSDLFAEDELADLTVDLDADDAQRGLLKVERMAL